MKGEEAEYTIALESAFRFPPKKRIRKALNAITGFVKKHSRAKEIRVNGEVNEFLHKNSKNIPRRVEAVLFKEEDRVTVFLRKGKGLKDYKEEAEKAKKEAEKKKKEEKGKAKKEEDAGQEAQKEKLEEKREKEKAGAAAEIKRKTGK